MDHAFALDLDTFTFVHLITALNGYEMWIWRDMGAVVGVELDQRVLHLGCSHGLNGDSAGQNRLCQVARRAPKK